MMQTKTLVVADDHPIFRRGLVEVIAETGNYRVIAEANNGAEMVNAILEYQPDYAILDISMPVMDGFEVLIKGQSWDNPPAFVMLTMYDDEAYLNKSLEYGAKGYVLKDNAEQEIINCLSMIEQGKHYLSPGVSWHLVNPMKSCLDKLSPMERKIFLLVSDFKTNKEISTALAVSIRTVENHRAHICKKLELSGPHALNQFATSFNTSK
jgi:DNA-binding NarL/FixJ family response regulator